ncbi:hypothetical protein SNE40_008737 [Patella caerulea]
MLEKDYDNIQTNLMFLIDNIQDPTRLCLSLFSRGVFNDDDVGKIRRCLQNESPRDATDKLLFVLLDSGRNAYQPFLECLVEVGYNKVIQRLQETQGESDNPQSEQVRLIEEREALMERVNEKEKSLGEVVKEKEHKLQMLQEKNERINKELDELRKKMAKMEDEKQTEKDERLQEISRLRAREDELLKNHEEIRENQRRILNQIQNLESRVEDLKAATISRENESPKLQSDVTNLFTLLQKTATTEDESSNLGNSENMEDENLETFDVCYHGNGKQQIHPVISTVPDLGSTDEVILGCNVDEEQDTIAKTKTNFLTLDDACLKGDLNNLKDLIESGHDINKKGIVGMTPILYCSRSHIEPVPKIKMILGKSGNIDDRDKGNNNVLHQACTFGSLETVQFLLTQGLDIHSRGFNGRTPILQCCQSEIEPLPKIKLILDKGGNIEDIDEDNNNMLHQACRFGCLETVQFLLTQGLDIHSRRFNGRTPILQCCESQTEPVPKIKLILDKGGNIHDIDKDNDNVLHRACCHGSLETVHFLLTQGLDVHSRGRNGLTPILQCCESQTEPVPKIKLILDKGGNIEDIAKYNDNVLNLACKYGRLETVQCLLTQGLDIHSRGFNGRTPILMCCQSEIEPLPKIKLILDNGGNIEDIDKKNNNVLHLACRFGSLETVQFLVTQGLDVHSSGFKGRTPILRCCESQTEPMPKIKLILDKGGNIDKDNNNVLHLACRFGCLETVQFLLTQGLDIHTRGFNGRTPILQCCESQTEPVPKIKLILDKGGNIEDIDKDKNNVLHLACRFGCLETVQFLLTQGLDIHSRGFNGRTPILQCCQSEIEPLPKIKLILDKGGNIEDIDIYNNNILHLACTFGSLETVQFLLTQGLDIHSRGFNGRTPILLCCESQTEPVPKIKLILDKCGNIEDIDKDNNNVLHQACRLGSLETVQFLLTQGLDVKSKNRSNQTPVDYCKFPSVPESYEKIKLLEEKLKL